MAEHVIQDVRRSRRLRHELPVAYRAVGGFVSDWATDISQGGMFINARAPLPVGTVVRLLFQLPGTAIPCEVVGRVTRVVCRDDCADCASGMAIEFTEVDREKSERIDAFVEALRPELDPG